MPRDLVLCFDGTWNTPDEDPALGHFRTNVAHLYEAVDADPVDRALPVAEVLKATAPGQGLKWYDPGVGSQAVGHLLGGLTGLGLSVNVRQGYEFLVRAWRPGDAIWLFGFSRGAYTARSLATMIATAGLLGPATIGQLDAAYDVFRQWGNRGGDGREARDFRDLYNTERPRLRFLGVWDTVGALGFPLEVLSDLNAAAFGLNDDWVLAHIDTVRHALALDEHRATYAAKLWNPSAPAANLEQRWFVGAHADVGGGYQERRLADITLAWMMQEAAAAGLALAPPPALGAANYAVRPTDSYAHFLKGAYARTHAPFTRGACASAHGGERLDASVAEVEAASPGYRPGAYPLA